MSARTRTAVQPPEPLTAAKRVTPPTAEELQVRETKVRADLRQSVWEASQHMSYDEIRAYAEAVLREIESDEP